MADGTSPAVERRRLAFELRRLRTSADKTIEQVARHLECSPGKISRIETGIVGAQIRDVRDLLDVYGLHGEERDQLLNLARDARRRAWWHDYAGVLPPESARFFGLEDGAETIDHLAGSTVVPGLLQTEAYARALIGSANDDPAAIALRIELRRRRQPLLTRPKAPAITAVIHEAALVALVGSAATMAGQLRRLVEVAALPNVTIRMLPLATGAHPAAGTSFSIFSFEHPGDPPIVHFEQLTSSSYRERPKDVVRYREAFAAACDLALSPDDSRQLVTDRERALRAEAPRGG